jgi:hypothetical protein
MSKQAKLTQALLRGQELTAAQIKARFGIANPRATISDIRGTGVAVVGVPRSDRRGNVKTFYVAV